MIWGEAWTIAGFLVGAGVFLLEARRRRLATEGFGWLALAGLCGGVLGAKLGEWGLNHADVLASHPTAFLNPQSGGRTIIGGVLGGWLCVEIVKRRLGIKRSTGDLFALALPAGEAVGRIGCYFNGCCFGVRCDLPWAIYGHGAWRQPSQFYLSAGALALFALLYAMRGKLPEGDLFKLYLIGFGASRFVLEFARERSVGLGGLSTAQWVCLGLAGCGGVLLSRRRAAPAQLSAA